MSMFLRGRNVPRRAPDASATVTLRLADSDDAAALHRLAVFYDRRPLSGPVLLAEVDGELQAALTLDGRRELMDPLRPCAALVELLALRAKHLRQQTPSPASAIAYDPSYTS
jgi:hypothetical protein